MTTTKKIYKIKKNSIKNLKTKKISLKSSSVLQKRKNKHNSLKKNKVINGGALPGPRSKTITVDIKDTLCPVKPSNYVQMLNFAFSKQNNIKYRKKIKKIACEFVEYKNSLTSNTTEQFKNIFDETNFLVFMCDFFDDIERTYINNKQCDPSKNFYNKEEIDFILNTHCQQKKNSESSTNNHIYATINNHIYATINNIKNTKPIIGNISWVQFLYKKLTAESNADTSPIIKIIVNKLEEYIKDKLIDSQQINTKLNLKELIDTVLGTNNTAIEFLSVFDPYKNIAKIIKPILDANDTYEASAQFKKLDLNPLGITRSHSTL